MSSYFEKQRKEAEARGRAEGEARGRAEGEARGKIIGKIETLAGLVRKGLLSLKDAAVTMGLSENEFSAQMAAL